MTATTRLEFFATFEQPTRIDFEAVAHAIASQGELGVVAFGGRTDGNLGEVYGFASFEGLSELSPADLERWIRDPNVLFGHTSLWFRLTCESDDEEE